MYTKKTNKGLEIRNKKLAKKAAKRNTVKDNQTGVCRFIIFSNPVIDKPDKHFVFKEYKELQGLQIENMLYYNDEFGNIKHVFINKAHSRIINALDTVPDWATPDLVKKYNAFRSKLTII